MTKIDVTTTKVWCKGRNIPYVFVGSMLCFCHCHVGYFHLAVRPMRKTTYTEAPRTPVDHSGRWIVLGSVVLVALVAAILVALRQMGVK